ncbi:hypothetical protein Goari_011772 [Gossypium aridum]|uniref:Uncharacterized protein n=1 Tax=Gossypium aridum TaxID=34290 RepID=A0A7J8WYD1_GOSAI|nr:hypothetical protein [Gossypium aridum]
MDDLPKNSDGYGPWILVERRGRRPPRTTKRSGSQDLGPTNNSRFHALETLAEDEGIQEQGSGLGTETGQRKTGPNVSHVMKEAGPSHIGRWLGIAMGHRRASLVELDIGEEVGASNLSLGQCGLNGNSPLVMELDQHKPIEGIGPEERPKEGIGRGG